MILQTLDIKNNCQGIYADGLIYLEPQKAHPVIKNCSLAWKDSPILSEEEYKFLYLFARGSDLGSFHPDPDYYKESLQPIRAHALASTTAKVDLSGHCFFDMIPRHQLNRYFKARQEALESLYNTTKEPTDYEILHKAHVLTSKISRQAISYKGQNKRILYNIFGSATGRLTTYKSSVPILTLNKDQRINLLPQNDVFVEIDFNAAEIRMLMALSGQKQPSGDIHEWIAKNAYQDSYTREETKKKVFSWLYNFSATDNQLAKIFCREIFRDFYNPENQILTTPFGRKLEVEERKAQNYLLQSTTSDQVLNNAYLIQKMLENKKSFLAFTLHDSIILDMSKKDAIMLKDIKKTFETTRWGNFLSSCKIGKNFADLKDLKI